MARVNVSIDSNVESVISDVDDVKDDIRSEIRKRVGAAMIVLRGDVKRYVHDDPDHTGNLFHSIRKEEDTSGPRLNFKVYADMELAAHAAIVEFGSGERTDQSFEMGNRVPSGWPLTGSAAPIGYPFESPDIDYNEEDPTDTRGFPTFYGFVKYIEEWMRTKPVHPETGNYFASAALIAATIVDKGNYAHPFLRPAWFENELQVKKAAKNAVRNAVR